ncbi:bifunctional 2-polyprenyl-6-hydroxyphenol methylase/3-demethylubiquinol 3-O-methyltransferase UbiG [Streptococcus merionis]|uniref:class I SAM-dependent methyltransferase n=1 Tax=Streptococcus merionis TaxID=400065 RepID=UPI0026ED2803|nr:class I SAM-dependent methyltransferase [Streptococcus merionis]
MHVEHYKDNIHAPWGQIFYTILFAHLMDIKDKRVLDFGSGFGLTADFLSANNEVLAIEPNVDMVAGRFGKDNYRQLTGSLELLSQFPNDYFDVITCHNVLEYVSSDSRAIYLKELGRVLKRGGQLSLVKHNAAGKAMQKAIFENESIQALRLISGDVSYESTALGHGQIYDLEALLSDTGLTISDYRGIRTFYGLQDNKLKRESDWIRRMTKLELAVARQSPYRDVAYFHHYTLIK